MKAVVAAFNQEKALEGAFSVIGHLQRLIVYSTIPGIRYHFDLVGSGDKFSCLWANLNNCHMSVYHEPWGEEKMEVNWYKSTCKKAERKRSRNKAVKVNYNAPVKYDKKSNLSR